MARRFVDGNSLICAAGNTAGSTRAGTTIALVRMYDATFDAFVTDTDIITGRAGTSSTWALFAVITRFFANGDGGAGGPFAPDKNTWVAVAVSKPSGSATFRYHLAAVGGVWTHQDSGIGGDGAGGTDNVLFGLGTIIGHGKFEIAAAARYPTALNDVAVEALGTTDMAGWMGAGPLAAWQFNQAISDPVTDLTGGGADQTAIIGTSVTADPVGWSYWAGAGPAPVSGTMQPAVRTAATAGGAFRAAATASAGARSGPTMTGR